MSAGSLEWDPKRLTPRAGSSGRVRAAHAGTPPQSPPPASQTPRSHSKGKIGDPGAPGGPDPGFREWRGEARPLPPLSGSRRGPSGRSPEVSAWRRGPQSRWVVLRGRHTRLPSPPLPRSTSSLRSSTSSAPASQAAAASIALPAAAAARHCAPGPARRGHMLHRRLGRSDPRRGPARLRPYSAGRRCGAPDAPSSLLRPPAVARARLLPSQGHFSFQHYIFDLVYPHLTLPSPLPSGNH